MTTIEATWPAVGSEVSLGDKIDPFAPALRMAVPSGTKGRPPPRPALGWWPGTCSPSLRSLSLADLRLCRTLRQQRPPFAASQPSLPVGQRG